MLTILRTVVPVFAIAGVGFVYGRYKKLPAQELSDLLVWVLVPCLVLGSVGSRSIDPRELAWIAAAALLVVLGCGLVGFLAFSGRPERRALLLPTMFMNSANMAFPLALLAFGEAGLVYQVVFYVAINLTHVTLGIAIARGRGGLKEVFRLPLVYAAALAIVLAATDTPLPESVAKPLDLVGKATIPLMLLLLGTRLRSVRITGLMLSLASSALRIGLGFGIGWLACWLLGLEGLARSAVLLGSAMPAAVLNVVLSEKYDLEPGLVSTAVAVSTFVSIGTTPLVLWFIMR
ncbi:MAG: AEC family transporter [Deltaproteobacteria bacterium]|nr:AEC family transporter [Deltaproteobacteria bacterium]